MPGDAYAAPAETGSFLNALEGPIPALRVALWSEGYAGEPVAGACRRAAHEAGRLCEALHCRVEEVRQAIVVRLPPAVDSRFRGNDGILFHR